MNSRKTNVRKRCLPAGAAAVLLVTLLCLAACYGGGPKPTDAELLARFRAHRPEIATLMKMMEEDRVIRRIDYDWTDPSNPLSAGISADRISQYRRILFDIDCPRGFYYDSNTGSVTIIAWAVGLVGSGASKSFMYKPVNPVPLVDELDSYQVPAGQDYVLAYRHIEGDWYLEYDAD